ncbi:MAG: redoxin family protein [Bacteroidota bacterium]
MKNLFLRTGLLLFLAACGTESTEPTPTEASVSGQIVNGKAEVIKFSFGDQKFEAPVEEGQFSLPIPLEAPALMTLKYGDEYAGLYLEPGDALQIQLDAAEFDESLTFSGQGAEESNYLIENYLLEEEMGADLREGYQKTAAEFLALSDAYTTKVRDHFDHFYQQHPALNRDFVTIQLAEIKYQNLNRRLTYVPIHEYYTEASPELAEDHYQFLEEADLNRVDLLESRQYPQFLRNVIDHQAQMALDAATPDAAEDRAQKTSLKLQLIGQLVKEQEIIDYLAHDATLSYLQFEGADRAQALVTAFQQLCKNEAYRSEVEDSYAKWAKIVAGAVAPIFVAKDVEGKTVSLKDLRGRNVYIDVWATWCGPCRQEMPYLEKLEAKYSEAGGLVFASVSIDENTEAWEKMVTEKEMQGTQLLADEAWESELCQQYLIRGIPRFILIDREGKIINANAPRPSSEEIDGILAQLADPNYTSMK